MVEAGASTLYNIPVCISHSVPPASCGLCRPKEGETPRLGLPHFYGFAADVSKHTVPGCSVHAHLFQQLVTQQVEDLDWKSDIWQPDATACIRSVHYRQLHC